MPAAKPLTGKTEATALREDILRFQHPSWQRSVVQVISSFCGFFAVCSLMYLLLPLSAWISVTMAPLAAVFVIRIFIIQHDCGHQAFFRSRLANDWVGRICSLATFTPFANWRRQHAQHHAGWNNLDTRPNGIDMYSSCLTVSEYRELSPFRRLRYRILYHPVVALLLLPPLIFLLLYRFPFDTPEEWRAERRSVYLTNLSLLVLIVGLGFVLGFRAVLLVQLPIMLIASTIGVWLFSVQHRFETTLWVRNGDWRMAAAALQGSSYLRLPRALHWVTGNIGFHHVHHLSSRIPNYRLRECHETVPAIRQVKGITLLQALRGARLALWDEANRQMVGFR
jgi:acyl-lipid omega-6 desaturase (Delta-12 desaturase)